MWTHLTDQQAKEGGAIAQPADNPVTSPDTGMYQAENLYRYTAMTSLLGKEQKGRAAFLQHYVLNHVMYRAQVEANRQQNAVDTTLVNLSLQHFHSHHEPYSAICGHWKRKACSSSPDKKLIAAKSPPSIK